MKIGILTQPLKNNYGGLLQCFAMQTVLKRLGHEPWIVRRDVYRNEFTWLERVFFNVKQVIKVFLGRKFVKLLSPKKVSYVKKNTKYFVSEYINPKTEIITTTEHLKNYHLTNKFDAYIVGSDQVWRPIYSPCITNYYLDFLPTDDNNVKRIAYAASFGVDEWEFSEEETKTCRDLLQKFDAISVRENSAVLLCDKYLNRADAVHVLDPTMLLDKEDYIRLVEKENEPKSPGTLFCYILDEDEKKNEIIDTIARQISAVPFTQMPKCHISYENLKYRLEDCVYPTVTAWLCAFMDAEMVVTDSFHGCVFSIIFNKPFIVYGNKGRGMARFHSLLSIFGLENRLVTNSEDALKIINKPINWEAVNIKKKEWQEKSLNFLKNNL